MRPTSKRLFKLISFLMIGVILVTGMIIFYNFNRTSIDNALATLDLIPKPEKLTELFFQDSANLPGSATSNQKIRFAFVIHNLETTDYQYVYEVSVNLNGSRHVIDGGKVLVKNTQYYVKNEIFDFMSSPGRQEVVVELTNMHQSIDFWIQPQ